MSEIPLWIKLPKLPMNCWSCDSLSRIGSVIGCPMFADECTTKQTRISYARMLIEVDVTKPLPDEIAIMDANGVIFHQRIKFEWKPEFCEKCQKVGHDCRKVVRTQQLNVPPKKKKKFTQVWQAYPTKPAAPERVPPRDQQAPQQLRVSTTAGKDNSEANINADGDIATMQQSPQQQTMQHTNVQVTAGTCPAMAKQAGTGLAQLATQQVIVEERREMDTNDNPSSSGNPETLPSQRDVVATFLPLDAGGRGGGILNTTLMSWLVWNIRGTNKRYKQRELCTYIRDNHFKLVGLVETRVKQDKAAAIANKIAPGWKMVHNYSHAINGRIWVLWDDNIYDVTVLSLDAHYVHCHITSRSLNIDCVMSVINGYNTVEQIKALWQALETLAPQCNRPWLIWGDFNALLTVKDRCNGAPVTSMEIKDFFECVHNLLLTEVAWKGEYFTWSNKQQDTSRVYSRLDRVMANDEWMLQFGHLVVEYRLPFISDHSPLGLTINVPDNRVKTPFKFFNVWAQHDTFMPLVRANWHRRRNCNQLQNIWLNLKGLRNHLKKLNKEEF
ncbi:uncharacterized protein LOC132601217 [Lycium barbarum]|uniref:uncharacterized protein LOC132601217 n=1 Tax=Lycium barbarum TaxID=112863 RepID=UPI00293EF109|nr:uncharacterized protein LOC132601217 [Lycium barbarum]